jgi:hypothetical protein
MVNEETIAKTIIVDARSFDLDAEDSAGDFQDAYLARFLNEAYSDGYHIQIIVDALKYTELKHALELACECCLQYLGDDVDLDLLNDSILTYQEYHAIYEEDLVKEESFDDINADELDPIGTVGLIISPKDQADYAPQISNYISYRRPIELSNINAYEEFKKERDADIALRNKVIEQAENSAISQLTIIEDVTFLHQYFGDDYTRILSDIGKNKKVFEFCNRQPSEITTPSSNPPISKGEFYLTHYFSNLLRSQNPNMAIDEEMALEATNTDLVIAISEMDGGDVVLEEIRAYAAHLSTPRL